MTRRQAVKTFASYQRIVEKTDEKKQRVISLMGLVGEIGDLHSMMKKLLLQRSNSSFRENLREEFGDVLWYLTSLASLYKIPLEEIAEANATKASALYSIGEKPQFDAKYPKTEQIPRLFTVRFYEKPLEGGKNVEIFVNGNPVGNTLTDNAHEDDGYRYHDVFHLAFAAVLGWSPVTRAHLGCKRKSVPKIDEVEDGARAKIIEEAISIFIFNHADDREWYKDSSSIDLGLIKVIMKMAAKLEAKKCTAKQWRDAIAQGYAAFADLTEHRGGEITVNLDEQKIEFHSFPKARARK